MRDIHSDVPVGIGQRYAGACHGRPVAMKRLQFGKGRWLRLEQDRLGALRSDQVMDRIVCDAVVGADLKDLEW